jgi:hypothetical protein
MELNMGWFRIIAIGLFCSSLVNAAQVPSCEANGQELAVNNAQILEWKLRTKSSFQARGHILGRLLRRYTNRSGHHHFSIGIGKSETDTIELIYNVEFGPIPALKVGSVVEACGDYITAKKRNGHYPPSPDGAILHWVHINPDSQGHEHGYVVFDGVVTGQTYRPH